jgi:DNA-binding CsgD family transcriptional regulator
MGRLTRREIECVQLAGLRLSNQEIADVLGITPSTVANYLQSANAKLGTSHRRGAAQALGIRYPGAGLTDAELAERLPERLRPADLPGVGSLTDDRPWLARVWRPPPGRRLVRLGVIVGVTALWLLVLGGLTSVVTTIFSTLDAWRPS